jgi:hypothetical protein
MQRNKSIGCQSLKFMQQKGNLIILIGFVFVIPAISNCNKKQADECRSYTTAQVTKVVGPNTVLVNQETDLGVEYYLINGCGQFESLVSTSNGYTTEISLNAKYDGCVCTDILLGGQTLYRFKPAQRGIYYLKFLQPDKTYFTDTITVN